MLKILQKRFTDRSQNLDDVFSASDITDPEFLREYSDYLFGEIREQLLFFFPDSECKIFQRFFEYLRGKNRFTYIEFTKAFQDYSMFLDTNKTKYPSFLESPDVFLQFLYELNINIKCLYKISLVKTNGLLIYFREPLFNPFLCLSLLLFFLLPCVHFVRFIVELHF